MAHESRNRRVGDPAAFVKARCCPDPGWFEHSADLWRHYLAWCAERQEEEATRTALGLVLRNAGFRRQQGHIVTWHGIRLLAR